MLWVLRVHIAAFALIASSVALAWGSQGHRMVGYVADADLTPRTRMAVQKIMQADSLSSVANWMDEVRDTPEGRTMQRWHFVTIPACGPATASCKNGNCAPGRIEWAREVLRTGTPPEALKALRVLVHLVGDIHQPLHAADNGDFGGNGVTVTNRLCVEFGATQPTACKLHTYWDTSLVKVATRGMSEEAAAAAWSTELGTASGIDSSAVNDWASESNEIARQIAYNFDGFSCKTKHLSFAANEGYDTAGVATVKRQIVKAGKRLARALNEVFD